MGSVAIFTAIFSDGLKIGVWPGIVTPAIPAGIGYGMRAELPALQMMTRGTETRKLIGHHQKVAKRIIMGVMASRALQLSVWVQLYCGRQQGGVGELEPCLGEIAVVKKGYGVIVGEIGPNPRGPCRYEPYSTPELNLLGLGNDCAQRDGPIMAAQTHL